ncbi:hypothetical protein WJ58_15595 [Burkholderia ubonensis]|nr:hypothetical protein WJ58_15595 [Burkholderia ubonensis]
MSTPFATPSTRPSGWPTDSLPREAVEAEFRQVRGQFIAQILEHSALDDFEQRVRIAEPVEFVGRALRRAWRGWRVELDFSIFEMKFRLW